LVVRPPTVKNPPRDVMALSSFAGGIVLLKSATIFARGSERSADSAGNRDDAIKNKITRRHRQNFDLRAGRCLLPIPRVIPRGQANAAAYTLTCDRQTVRYDHCQITCVWLCRMKVIAKIR
jgi:hypothetical protein